MDDWYRNQDITTLVNLGWALTNVDQIIPILDFCCRNGIELHSADFAFASAASRAPEQLERVSSIQPDINRDTLFSFAWFTLNEATPPFHFPALSGDKAGGLKVAATETEHWRVEAERWRTEIP